MLETKFKVAFLLVVIFMASLPVIGIIKGTRLPPVDPTLPQSVEPAVQPASTNEAPLGEDMVLIPAGPFIRGTMVGGYDEQPERTIDLDAFLIDPYEVTNRQYQAFVAATGHRKAAPPSRYAKNTSRTGGVSQPATYVSWEDADAYCRWKGRRLPTEAEWEKAMRGTDGRLWPWGNEPDSMASNRAVANDGYEVTAPVGSFKRDVSPFGVADGAGNVMEWVADWYAEDAYRDQADRNPQGPDHGVYRVMRGGGYTTSGSDARITSRSKMVPDFRDETIGFRCAGFGDGEGSGTGSTGVKKS
ncbi:MAG: formylglycine-generating enzyme family protein [Nitrospirae bacterium]|nr:formylglycine-generating enzyme family protein [Nitrospirota bacterium]